MIDDDDDDFWFGFEGIFFLGSKTNLFQVFQKIQTPQGQFYYCSVGGSNALF